MSSATSTRVNLAIPLELAIQIEKECEKRGIQRAQFIKEILHEKIQKKDSYDDALTLRKIKEDIDELKKILMLLVEVNKR